MRLKPSRAEQFLSTSWSLWSSSFLGTILPLLDHPFNAPAHPLPFSTFNFFFLLQQKLQRLYSVTEDVPAQRLHSRALSGLSDADFFYHHHQHSCPQGWAHSSTNAHPYFHHTQPKHCGNFRSEWPPNRRKGAHSRSRKPLCSAFSRRSLCKTATRSISLPPSWASDKVDRACESVTLAGQLHSKESRPPAVHQPKHVRGLLEAEPLDTGRQRRRAQSSAGPFLDSGRQFSFWQRLLWLVQWRGAGCDV